MMELLPAVWLPTQIIEGNSVWGNIEVPEEASWRWLRQAARILSGSDMAGGGEAISSDISAGKGQTR